MLTLNQKFKCFTQVLLSCLRQIRYFTNPAKFGDLPPSLKINPKKRKRLANGEKSKPIIANDNVQNVTIETEDYASANRTPNYFDRQSTKFDKSLDGGKLLPEAVKFSQNSSSLLAVGKKAKVLYLGSHRWDLNISSCFVPLEPYTALARKIILEIIPLDLATEVVQIASRITLVIVPTSGYDLYLNSKRAQLAVDLELNQNPIPQYLAELSRSQSLIVLRHDNFDYSGHLSLLIGTVKLNDCQSTDAISSIKVFIKFSGKPGDGDGSEDLSFIKVRMFNSNGERLGSEDVYYSGTKYNVTEDSTGIFFSHLFPDPCFDKCGLEWPTRQEDQRIASKKQIAMAYVSQTGYGYKDNDLEGATLYDILETIRQSKKKDFDETDITIEDFLEIIRRSKKKDFDETDEGVEIEGVTLDEFFEVATKSKGLSYYGIDDDDDDDDVIANSAKVTRKSKKRAHKEPDNNADSATTPNSAKVTRKSKKRAHKEPDNNADSATTPNSAKVTRKSKKRAHKEPDNK